MADKTSTSERVYCETCNTPGDAPEVFCPVDRYVRMACQKCGVWRRFLRLEVRKITEAIKNNRANATMYICLYEGNLEILVQPSTLTINISKLPDEIGKPWVKFEPSGHDDNPEYEAPYLWMLVKEAAA